jgi:hypothetical protein
MATANRGEPLQRQPVRWGRNLTVLGLILALALTAWFWTRMRATALSRAAYAAETGCLCRYAAGRSGGSCQADPNVKQSWVGLHEDASAHSMTASVPVLASQTARWTPDGGCVLDPWQD